MLGRLVLRRASNTLRAQSRRAASDHAPAKQPSMDELPVPSGSWAEMNAKVQAKNNMKMLGGILFLGFTTAVAYQSGKFDFGLAPPMKN